MIHIEISKAITASQKAQNKRELLVYRGLKAQLENFANNLKIKYDDLNDNQTLEVIQKYIKERKNAIDLYTQGNRMDLVEQEEFEVKLLESYMPTMLSDEEIKEHIALAISNGASHIGDIMKYFSSINNANKKKVSQYAKEALA